MVPFAGIVRIGKDQDAPADGGSLDCNISRAPLNHLCASQMVLPQGFERFSRSFRVEHDDVPARVKRVVSHTLKGCLLVFNNVESRGKERS
jgi:hypothetical protein